MIYGYCRVSTQQQSIERQIRNITKEFPNVVIYKESYTGTKIDRPVFSKLLSVLKKGDTVVFDSVSRMSRNAEEGFILYEKLFTEGVRLVFLKEHHIDTETYQNALNNTISIDVRTEDVDTDNFVNGMLKLVNDYIMSLARKQITIAFDQAQKEVDDIHQRTKEGIQVARSKGKQIGRPTKNLDLLQSIEKVQRGELSISQACRDLNISRGTWYSKVKEYEKRVA